MASHYLVRSPKGDFSFPHDVVISLMSKYVSIFQHCSTYNFYVIFRSTWYSYKFQLKSAWRKYFTKKKKHSFGTKQFSVSFFTFWVYLNVDVYHKKACGLDCPRNVLSCFYFFLRFSHTMTTKTILKCLKIVPFSFFRFLDRFVFRNPKKDIKVNSKVFNKRNVYKSKGIRALAPDR